MYFIPLQSLISLRNTTLIVRSLFRILQRSLNLIVLFFCMIHSAFASTPEWVVQRAIPTGFTVPANDVRGGVYYLLLDKQVLVEADNSQTNFTKMAIFIENQSGVEDQSEIALDYNPAFQTIDLHSLIVIRDGQEQDRIANSRIETFQRETELERLTRTGSKTLSIILDDVRVGDIVSYSYSLRGSNPVYEDNYASLHSLSWSAPLASFYFDVFWYKNQPLKHKVFNSNDELVTELITNGASSGIRYRVEKHNIKAVKQESNTPQWYSAYAELQLTDADNWSQIANWATPLYEDAVIVDDEIQSIAFDIKAKNISTESRVKAALNFVQTEIRYLGLQLGNMRLS